MGRPRQRVFHFPKPLAPRSRCAKTYGTAVRAQDGKSSNESARFALHAIHTSSRLLSRQYFELCERGVGRADLYQRAPTPVPERFMPDTAPDEPGIVGPVGVPPDPPALLLPKPVFRWKLEVVAGPVKPPPKPRSWPKPPMWACCAKAASVVPGTSKATSNRRCLLRMTSPFRF